MKTVEIPIVDGKYNVLFPPKCIYCGIPKEVTIRMSGRSKSGRKTRLTAMDVPYCAEHARESKRNDRALIVGLIASFLVSCCVLFSITSSIIEDPSTELYLFLAFIAIILALAGRWMLRQLLSRSRETMADMSGGQLGFRVIPLHDKVSFSFVNAQIADEFAQLNGQKVNQSLS